MKKGTRKENIAYTSEFRREFEADTARLLRRQVLRLAGLVVVLNVLIAVVRFSFITSFTQLSAFEWARLILQAFTTLLYAYCFYWVKSRRPRDTQLDRLAFILVVIHGLTMLASAYLPPGIDAGRVSVALLLVGFVHMLASVFLPWSPTATLKPLVPLLALNALCVLIKDSSLPFKIFAIALSPVAGVPGLLVCAVRHSNRLREFKLTFLQQRYGEIRQELVNASQIHGSLFPSPHSDDAVHFDYSYEPMRLIGGDFLFARRGPDGSFSIVLLDVTGHGIPAALTVNRLHGELERLFAENPAISPGEVLKALNRYVHLTLAIHSIYVTAFCARTDGKSSNLSYASGGHPPAFVRTIDGRVMELDSTSFVLGACADADYDPEPRSVEFHAGDALIAYTDGVIEARSDEGKMFGIATLRRLIASERIDRGWCRHIQSSVEGFREGPTADDVLVIELVRTGAVERAVQTDRAPRAVPAS